MANTIWPIGAPAETETLTDDRLFGGYAPLTIVPGKKQRKFTFLQVREWLAEKLIFLTGIKLNGSRIESKELSTGSVGTGFVTIAETNALSVESTFARFSVIGSSGRGKSFVVGLRPSAKIASDMDYVLKITGNISNIKDANSLIGKIRIVYSETDGSAGWKVQAEILDSSSFEILMNFNSGRTSNVAGLKLITPTLVDNTLCPDGSAGSFITESEVSGTQKVLWTGPLSTTGVPTSLNANESFDDWDQILIYFNVFSDVDASNDRSPVITMSSEMIDLTSIYAIGTTGVLALRRDSSTTFRLNTKTVTAGNIQRIIGVKL